MPPLRKRRPDFDPEGRLSRTDLNAILDEISTNQVRVDRALEALGVTERADVATLTRTIRAGAAAAAVAAAVTPSRRVISILCVANQATYPLTFTLNTAEVVMAYLHGLLLTPLVDYSVTSGAITLKPNVVPTISEGYILVEGAPQ